MTMQLRLPGVDPPHEVKPAADRAQPVVWVRRLRVLRALQPGDEHVLRDIQLRRGLNIVWTPPGESDRGNALFQSGVAGHTAGKTTFCRLLRYALGEGGFAAEATRRRIREKIPAGWLIAEVIVGGRAWAVARPLGIGHRPFCVEGGDVEQITSGDDRTEYQTFLDAIDRATTAALPAARFPTRDESIRWAHILPWLSRDQECRFADFLKWRHSSSGSDAPALNVDERQLLIRSVLGLISDEERAEQARNARLVAQRKTAAQREPLLSHQATVDHQRVQDLLGIQVAPPSSGLFGSQARAELNRRKAELTRKEEALAASDRRAELRGALEAAVQAETNAQRDVDESEMRLAAEQAAVQQLTARAKGDEQTDLLAALPPARHYCNVAMTLAREHGCPLATTRPAQLAQRRSERSAAEELRDLQEVVRVLENGAQQKRSAFETAEAATREARRALMVAATAHDEEQGRLLDERAQLRHAERLVSQAADAWTGAVQHAETIEQLAHDINASYTRQEELRRAGRQALGRFSATFDYVLRALLGDGVQGRVDTSGRALTLLVEHHGERESAALSTVKLLAFDLAAMTDSVEGRGCFPRFLVHDGPREADMAEDIYERLFLYARKLEDCFGGEPGFQYIVTTTTQPPTEFLNEPWMRLRLAGTPAHERLMRMDL